MRTTLDNDQYRTLCAIYGDDQLRPDYSGRGMYGKTCIAYEGDEPTVFMLDLAETIIGETPSFGELRDCIEEIGEPSRDSMGLGSIYYWRGITVEGHERESLF